MKEQKCFGSYIFEPWVMPGDHLRSSVIQRGMYALLLGGGTLYAYGNSRKVPGINTTLATIHPGSHELEIHLLVEICGIFHGADAVRGNCVIRRKSQHHFGSVYPVAVYGS